MSERTNLFATGARLGIFMFLTAWLPGCTTIKMTEPARTATEQLLLSTAADHALKTADLEMFNGIKVYLDATYFDSYDSKYALGTIRDALSRAGAILVSAPSNSDAILEARSGALSTDSSTSLFGIPSLGIPIPLTGAIQTPEVAIYKSQKQSATAKIALLALASPTGQHLYSSGSLVGKSYNNFYHFVGVNVYRTDLPEKKKDAQNAEPYQTWQPDYTPQNFAATNASAASPVVPNSSTNDAATNSPAH